MVGRPTDEMTLEARGSSRASRSDLRSGLPIARPAVSDEPAPTVLGLDAETRVEDDGSRRPDAVPLPFAERRFGNYELIRRLAFGGMGEVYLARPYRQQDDAGHAFSRPVVIKRILAHMRRDDRHRQMFLEEARLQALLKSPHIVQIHDVGEVDGSVFLAMEHLHGPSWRAVIDACRQRKQHLPLSHVIDMTIQAGSGLADAHSLADARTGLPLHIVHRDINPHNILVSYEGVVKLIDFGIAKSDLREAQTETGTIKGKFAYMSPEQSAAEPLDQRSDLFALGICLYELATLSNPFRKDNVVLSLEAIQRGEPAAIERIRPAAHGLSPMIKRALAKRREDRYPSCAELVDDLRKLKFDGLVPPAKEPIEVFLRSLFTAELEAYYRVLELVAREDESGIRRGLPPPVMLDSVRTIRNQLPSELSSSQPVPAMPVPSLVAMPTPATIKPVEMATSPTAMHERAAAGPSGWWAAVVGVSVAVIATALWMWPDPPAQPALVAKVVDAVVTPPVVTQAVVAEPVVAGTVVAEPVVAEPVVAEPVEDITETTVPLRKPPKQKPKPKDDGDAQPAAEVVTAVARLTVGADGFVIKGSRNLLADKPAVFTIDNPEAPFGLTATVRWQQGTPVLNLSSTPWAIVIVDGVGRGKTPLSDVKLTAGKKHRLQLRNPSGATLELTVLLVAASAG